MRKAVVRYRAHPFALDFVFGFAFMARWLIVALRCVDSRVCVFTTRNKKFKKRVRKNRICVLYKSRIRFPSFVPLVGRVFVRFVLVIEKRKERIIGRKMDRVWFEFMGVERR